MHISRHLLLLFFSITAVTGYSQTGAPMEGATAFATSRKASKPVLSVPTASRVYNHCKKLSQTYSGYAIEVSASEYPLQPNHPVFRQFGNIFYEKLREGGYSYLIKGEFSSEEAALHFMKNIIVPRASGARLFFYEEGIRKAVTE